MPPAKTRRREEILAAALDLFAAHGVQQTSMDLIRRSVGISNGSLFYHFPTKDELIAALYIQITSDYQAMMTRLLARRADAEKALGSLVRGHIRWVADNPDKARFLVDMRRAEAVAAAKDEISALNRRMFARFTEWLKPFVAAGVVRDLPPEIVAALILGPASEFTRAWLRAPDPARARRVAPILADALWRSVRVHCSD